MKISFRAIVAAALLTGFVPSPASAADTNKAPAAAKTPLNTRVPSKGATQPVVKKAAPAPAPVYHPEPAIARQANVNIRGQALLNSEIVGHLKKGDVVTVLEEITLKKAKQDEPAKWFRIVLPPSVGAWIHASFIADGAVKATKLNLRGGPGEEYSILGQLQKGAPIRQLETKGDWIKIEAPTNAYGFVAMHLLDKTPVVIAAVPKTNEVAAVPPTKETVTPPTTPVVAEPPTVPVVTPPVITPPTVPVELPPDGPIEKVKKIVSREGILKGSFSIQAPSYFELRALDTGKTIDYVFSPSTNLLLREFKGKRIIVTGEELLDERWQNTPVIIVDTLQTVP